MSEHLIEQKHLETVREESMDDVQMPGDSTDVPLDNQDTKLIVDGDQKIGNSESNLSDDLHSCNNDELSDQKDGNKMQSNDELSHDQRDTSLDHNSVDNLTETTDNEDDNEFALMNKTNDTEPIHRNFSPINEEENVDMSNVDTQIDEEQFTNNIMKDYEGELPDLGKQSDTDDDIRDMLKSSSQDGDEFKEGIKYDLNACLEKDLSDENYVENNVGDQSENKDSKLRKMQKIDSLEDTYVEENQIVEQVDSENEGSMDERQEKEELIQNKRLKEKYKEILSVRSKLQERNFYLQNRISEIMAAKKVEENGIYNLYESNTEMEEKYLKYIAQLDNFHAQTKVSSNQNKKKLEDLSTACTDKQEIILQQKQKCSAIKNQILNQVVGWGCSKDQLELMMQTEERKEEELEALRLEFIKLTNKINQREETLKSKDQLAKGLYMIDYEQMKIENQTYNEKIEERNEEIESLKKRISSCVQKLSHHQLKVDFLEHENQNNKQQLQQLDQELAAKRGELSRAKRARDVCRAENEKLKRDAGLLNKQHLLSNYASYKDNQSELIERLDKLKSRHAELSLQLHRSQPDKRFTMPHLNTMC